MNSIPRRKERRAIMKYQGFLKMKSELPFKKWLEFSANSVKGGKEIFEINRDHTEKMTNEVLEKSESKLISSWRTIGYDESEISQLREANAMLMIRDSLNWKTDKKVARKIMKDVHQSFLNRLNG